MKIGELNAKNIELERKCELQRERLFCDTEIETSILFKKRRDKNGKSKSVHQF